MRKAATFLRLSREKMAKKKLKEMNLIKSTEFFIFRWGVVLPKGPNF